MTQVWPRFGVAPVPSTVSVICSPDAVVMVFFAVVCAVAGVSEPAAIAPTAASRAIALSRRESSIQISSKCGCRLKHVCGRVSFLCESARAGNGLDVDAYRCVGVAARNRQNELRPTSPLRPVVTRRELSVNAGNKLSFLQTQQSQTYFRHPEVRTRGARGPRRTTARAPV